MFGGNLGQTIAIMDKSGKIVSSRRHLFDVFNDAKATYKARKAEVTAEREAKNAAEGAARGFGPPRRAFTDMDGVNSEASGRRRSHRSSANSAKSHRRHRSGETVNRRHSAVPGGGVFQSGWQFPDEKGKGIDRGFSPEKKSLTRRSTSGAALGGGAGAVGGGEKGIFPTELPPRPSGSRRASGKRSPGSSSGSRAGGGKRLSRARSWDGIDMDLAYGEEPEDLMGTATGNDEVQLRGLVGRAKGMLDEANCLQFTASQTISRLQQNPEQMAAVALTLAEISNLVKKMGPGPLLKIRTVAPAVFALLSSPQFLVAGGVAVGVTIVALGGYKIVKKVQERRAMESQDEDRQMIALRADVGRVDTWRRGVADIEARSVGTTPEGEFIPAQPLAGMIPASAPVTPPEHRRSSRTGAPLNPWDAPAPPYYHPPPSQHMPGDPSATYHPPPPPAAVISPTLVQPADPWAAQRIPSSQIPPSMVVPPYQTNAMPPPPIPDMGRMTLNQPPLEPTSMPRGGFDDQQPTLVDLEPRPASDSGSEGQGEGTKKERHRHKYTVKKKRLKGTDEAGSVVGSERSFRTAESGPHYHHAHHGGGGGGARREEPKKEEPAVVGGKRDEAKKVVVAGLKGLFKA